METGNRFVRNLGAQTAAPETLIDGSETDDEPATFWLVNPSNDLIGNVAAGSQNAGYWIEPKLRGARASWYPDLDPRYEPLGVWDSNIAHSNLGNAVSYGWCSNIHNAVFFPPLTPG